jgi:predicted aminopeptidase
MANARDIARRLHRAYASPLAKEAADLLVRQEEEIESLRAKYVKPTQEENGAG